MTKIGLNSPMSSRVKVWRYFQGLSIKTNNFAVELKFILGQNQTRLGGSGGGVGGWTQVENITISAPNWG